jgi:hypothetical protein
MPQVDHDPSNHIIKQLKTIHMKKFLSYFTLIILIGLTNIHQIHAQGCVAIRSTGGASCMRPQASHDSSGWSLTVNSRYFNSYKHFVGTQEQKQRIEQGTNVINHTFSTDFFLLKNLNRRWSIAVDLPVIGNTRSSLYEHGGNAAGPSARHNTHSFGIGDVRISVYRWLWDPKTHEKWNVQAGLGIKLPTGDYKYQDYFWKNDTTRTLGPVDQSIQLGDGGTGFTAELNAFWSITHMVNLYGNFYYLANPREQNGVSTARGGTPSAAAIANGSEVMSVPDQYMYRFGVNAMFGNFNASIGLRKECVTVRDLIGGSNGFRRPGTVTSLEPGGSYTAGKFTAFAYVPVALIRDRTQSVPDMIRTEKTGVYAHGDAAFADYAINVGFTLRF